jgi:hypothetical protein
MHFRKRQKITDVQQHFASELEGVLPPELSNWLSFITRQIQGHNLRARDPAGASPHLLKDSYSKRQAA